MFNLLETMNYVCSSLCTKMMLSAITIGLIARWQLSSLHVPSEHLGERRRVALCMKHQHPCMTWVCKCCFNLSCRSTVSGKHLAVLQEASRSVFTEALYYARAGPEQVELAFVKQRARTRRWSACFPALLCGRLQCSWGGRAYPALLCIFLALCDVGSTFNPLGLPVLVCQMSVWN